MQRKSVLPVTIGRLQIRQLSFPDYEPAEQFHIDLARSDSSRLPEIYSVSNVGDCTLFLPGVGEHDTY
jgi:hypothetical protein